MSRRPEAWLAAIAAVAWTAWLSACSGTSASEASDASAASDQAVGPDVTQPETSGAPDAAAEAAHGHCEPVTGSCDLVLQTCPSGQECLALVQADGGWATSCDPVRAAQHIEPGYPCCPAPSSADDPCLPGLTCVGDPCTGDAAGGGLCSPYCCEGDDTPCGSSSDGVPGHCDLGIVDTAGATLYDVCDYALPCKPFGVQPCPAGDACLVQDTSGGAQCAQVYNGGAPAAQEGAACTFVNSCADGLMCLTDTGPDGGLQQVCLMLCSTGQGTPPFDAGALGTQPDMGGCDTGKQCKAAPQIFPAWLGVCL
jgi:hypothetical protein